MSFDAVVGRDHFSESADDADEIMSFEGLKFSEIRKREIAYQRKQREQFKEKCFKKLIANDNIYSNNAPRPANINVEKPRQNATDFRGDDNSSGILELEKKDKADLKYIGFKLAEDYADAVNHLKSEYDLGTSEFWRKAAFVILKNPTLLETVHDQEARYKDSLKPSRHHK